MKNIKIILLIILAFLLGLYGASKIPQKQEWVDKSRFNKCNFYEKPKCVLWERKYFDGGKFEGCQGWSCYN